MRKTVTGTITDETALEFTSGGSNTQIVPSTLSYRRTESNSYLGDSHDGSYSHSSYTSSSPSSLSRSQGIRRRHHSRSDISDKENAASGYRASQSRSTLSSWMRSCSTTPTPAPSTATLSALGILDGSGSEGYETANSPSTASFKSLPSISSETDNATVEQCKTEVSTGVHTGDRCQCASDVSSEYVIANKCKTEASTEFYTAEKCKSVTETEFVTTALCECERMEQSETHYETASLCKTIPSEASTPRSLAVDLPIKKAPTPPTKTPTEVPSLQSPESDIHPELPPKSVPLPPSEISPTISSASRDLESEHIEETSAPPPPTIDTSANASPPPLLATVIQTVISPSSGLTPLSLTSTASSSLSRTPSSVSSISSLPSRISLAEDDGISLADVPPPSEVSTEPSLLSSLHSSSISSVHCSPQPTRVPPPEISLSDHSPAPSPSVSSDTPQTNQPLIHSVLETAQMQTIYELDHLRSQERHEISKNIRIIRDELYDLSEYVRTHLVETEGLIIPERPEPPAVSHRDQSVVAISERRDQSVVAMSVVSEPRITPIGPRSRHLIPIPLTPPPVRSPSTRSTSSSMSLISFLSSHHSDDFSLLDVDEVEVEMHPPSPAWPSEPSSPSSGLTPSIISSSEPSPGPTLSLTSSSSSPTPPPSSPTLSTGSMTSSDSTSVTARQVPGITLTTIRDMLAQVVREQTTALWDGQAATNHVLDELRQSRPVPQDNTEIFERLHHIQALIETLIDARRVTTQRDDEESVEETETI
ncbi:hypothetical protein L210DRAFT_3655209 [Boletus edulis BED1]|uniref:Uncharacterized protein n=2 Tax=Boletus edulis BED1 TaxID=1328754 RepID=A0AAD4BCL7_BOLED|nr:hypothetical protein L210DRAFT_3655209 [Boletus edulis BED1]